MIFGLFNKKQKAVPHCMCQPSLTPPTTSPFEEVERLTGPYDHENVSLAQCMRCGRVALYYSADIYDDYWQYWCVIDEAERAQLLQEDDLDEPQRPRQARQILEKSDYLVLGPVRGFEWVPPGHPVMEGPPW
jgi:hypothetical protein